MTGRGTLSTFHRGVLRELDAVVSAESRVLEIGSTDHSFRNYLSVRPSRWITMDLFPPADILIDLDVPELRMPVERAQFDVVICTEVMEHLRYATALLDEIHRVLAPDGWLLISVPNITSLTYRVAWALGRIPSCAASADLGPDFNGTGYKTSGHARWVAGHVGDYNPARLQSVLRSRGFDRVRCRGSGLHHRRQIAPAWLVPVALSSAVLAVARRVERPTSS